MRYHFFLHYGWFFQNLEKDFIPILLHTTVYLECVRSYAWSKGHSDPDLASVKTHIATVHEGKKPFTENENEKLQEEKDTFENRFPQVGKDEKQQIYSGSELEEEYTNIKADLYEYSGKEKGLKRQ